MNIRILGWTTREVRPPGRISGAKGLSYFLITQSALEAIPYKSEAAIGHVSKTAIIHLILEKNYSLILVMPHSICKE